MRLTTCRGMIRAGGKAMDMGLFLELFHAARYAYIRIRQRNRRALCSKGNTRWRERVASGRAIWSGQGA